MKTWKKDGSVADFEELVMPFMRAIKFAYKLERQNENKSIPYTGYGITPTALACDFDVKESLSKGKLAWQDEAHGRSALEVILCKAMQVGIEQGRRMMYNEIKTSIPLKIRDIDILPYEDKGSR